MATTSPPIRILAIETSCDETAAAVVENGTRVISNVVASQIEIHQKYGGVVPEVASRHHVESILPVITEALSLAELSDPYDPLSTIRYPLLDAIAVTQGPGLMGSLLVGIMAAKTLAMVWNKPLIAVNHIEGHIYANFLGDGQARGGQVKEPAPAVRFPFICLVVSGGHTEILFVPEPGKYELLGRTRDDAAGECFDKSARHLGIGYPGGPLMDKIAKTGNPHAVRFPKTLLTPLSGQTNEANIDFSFSGLKTEVTMYIDTSPHPHINASTSPQLFQRRGKNATKTLFSLPDLVASIQESIVTVLVANTVRAAKTRGVNQIVMAGGVSANSRLREKMKEACETAEILLSYPPLKYCTDNAAMIAAAAYPKFLKGEFDDLSLVGRSRMNIH
jgi:N6-L-threonylcarbamoyladenine synthase